MFSLQSISGRRFVRGGKEIMNAEKAREICRKDPDTQDQDEMDKWWEASGYLAALEGPEVKALVETLEKFQILPNYPTDKLDAQYLMKTANKALAAFRKLVQP